MASLQFFFKQPSKCQHALVTLMTVALMLVIFLVAYLLKLQFFLLYGLLSLNMGVIIPLILCAIVYTVILGNGMLFAAALVAFDEVPPFEAFKLGLSAATRNFFSLLISFILIILLLIVIGFIAGFIGVFLTKLGVVGLIISVVLGLSLLFLVISYMYGFSYHAYNGVFGDNLKY